VDLSDFGPADVSDVQPALTPGGFCQPSRKRSGGDHAASVLAPSAVRDQTGHAEHLFVAEPFDTLLRTVGDVQHGDVVTDR
jgi:hypothetical protein